MSTTEGKDGEKADCAVAVGAEKPSLTEYLNDLLPFKMPRIPLPQTAKNLDKAVGKLVLAGAEHAVKWSERRQMIKDAEADARVKFIRKGAEVVVQEIDDGNVELAHRAVAAGFGRMFEQQKNRERIVEYAATELENDPGSSDASDVIDGDWLNSFSDKASGVSNEEMQALWGRILAGEIRKPGTFKLRTLQALTLVDANEARLIHASMHLVVDGRAFYVGSGDDRQISWGNVLELQSADVIQSVGNSLAFTLKFQPDNTLLVRLAGQHALFLEGDGSQDLRLINVCPLTAFGRELFSLAQVDGPTDRVAESIAKELAREGITITLVEIVPIAGSENAKLRPLKKLYP